MKLSLSGLSKAFERSVLTSALHGYLSNFMNLRWCYNAFTQIFLGYNVYFFNLV